MMRALDSSNNAESEVIKELSLTPLQLGMLFHVLEDPIGGTYISQAVSYMDGFKPELYTQAWNIALARHEILRASLAVNELLEASRLQIHAQITVPVRQVDLSEKSLSSQSEIIRKLQKEEREIGFDLSKPPLMRLVYIKLSSLRWAVLNTHSHIILDGWSGGILGKEIAQTYDQLKRGTVPELSQPKQFSDYIEWLSGRSQEHDLDFWRQKLNGVKASTPLPWEAVTFKSQPARRVDSCSVELSAEESEHIESFAKQQRSTVNVIVEAAWALLLSRYAARQDVIYGLVVSGRPHSLEGVEDIVGMFLNTVPVRVTINTAESVSQYIHRLQDERYDSQEYEHTPLLEIRKQCDFPGRRELFGSVVARKDVSQQGRTGLRSRRSAGRSKAAQSNFKQNFPLLLNIQVTYGIELKLTFHQDFIDKAYAALLLRQLAALIRAFCANAADALAAIDLQQSSELQQMLALGLSEQQPPSAGNVGPIPLLETWPAAVADCLHLMGSTALKPMQYLSELAQEVQQRFSSLHPQRDASLLTAAHWFPETRTAQGEHYLYLCGDQSFLAAALISRLQSAGSSLTICSGAPDLDQINERICSAVFTTVIAPEALLQALATPAAQSECGVRRWIGVGRSPLSSGMVQTLQRKAPGAAVAWIILDRHGIPLLHWDSAMECIRPGQVVFGRPVPGRQLILLDAAARLSPTGLPGRLHQMVEAAPGLSDAAEIHIDEGDYFYLLEPELSGVGWNLEGSVVALASYRQQSSALQGSGQLTIIEEAVRQVSGIEQLYAVHEGDHGLGVCLPRQHLVAIPQLASALAVSLPVEYFPTCFRVYDDLPFGADYELDRLQLAASSECIKISDVQSTSGDLRELEQSIHSIWCDILKSNEISLDDNFFVLGGHSLSATRVASRLTRLLNRHIPIHAIFDAPTVRSLAHWLKTHQADHSLSATIAVQKSSRNAPTTFTQQQLWILGQLFSGMAAYSIPSNIRYNGEIRLDLLESTLLWIIDRHQILRTVFVTEEGEPRQVVIDTPAKCPILHLDLSSLGSAERDAEVKAAIRQEARRKWDLETGPLLRCLVLSLNDQEHIICTIFHHIIADGPSVGIFSREVERIYTALLEGQSDHVRLPELQLQYSDYAIWERDSIQGELFAQQLSYWRSKLEGSVPLELPTDFPRPAVHSFAGKKVKFSLGREQLAAIKELTKQQGCTLFAYFVACYQYLLHHYSSQRDVVIGTAMTNRVRSELEPLIGLFVNTLPLRTFFEPHWTFNDLLASVKQTCVGAFSNMELPFEETVKVIQPTRDLSKQGSPLFQHMIINQPPGRDRQGQGKRSSFEPGESHHDTGYSNFDLLLSTHEITGSRVDCTLAYDTELYREDTVERLIRRFSSIVTHMALEPEIRLDSYSLLSPDERSVLLDQWAGGVEAIPQYTIIDQLQGHSKTTPTAIAIEYAEQTINYQQLFAKVCALATHLRPIVSDSQRFVAVCLPKSPSALIAILAVMMCRGIVVALDPTSPAERLKYISLDADISVFIGSADLAFSLQLPASISVVDFDSQIIALLVNTDDALASHDGPLLTDVAYMIYTSGSTGKPKGVLIEHRNLMATVQAQVAAFGIQNSDRVLQVLSLGFDAAFGEIFRCFCVGARLVIPHIPRLLPSQEMLDLMIEKQITVAAMSASMLTTLPEPTTDALKLRVLTVGGEACAPKVAARWKRRCQLINGYGPTETTIGATYCNSWKSRAVAPLGRPLPGVRVYILNSQLNLVSPDIVGELFIGGNGVGRGYHNRPELTAEKFIPDPFVKHEGARMYRTGDRVKWRSDGQLEFIGRFDNQVKIRGYRVELGEIESAAISISGITHAGIVTLSQGDQTKLALYLCQESSTNLSTKDVREALRATLPEYMLPTYIISVQSLPLNSSGKLDKARLPPPKDSDVELSTEYSAPLDELEQSLADLWQTVLGSKRVGRHDNFFELGGDSISCIRVSARASELGLTMDPKLIFKNQTIALLAEALR